MNGDRDAVVRRAGDSHARGRLERRAWRGDPRQQILGFGAERDQVLAYVDANAALFHAAFRAWLLENFGIWRSFKVLADKARRAGRRHYSARTIVEVLRWETEIREPAGADFKINNNAVPDLARLYNGLACSELFRLRDQEATPC